MNYMDESLALHERLKGKLSYLPKIPLRNKTDLSLLYTPGVASPCRVINKRPEAVFELTGKGNTVAVISDGSAVLGLGNIGPEAGIPVMEGKCVLFREFGGVDAVPLCLKTQDSDKIIEVVKALEPSLGGVNLEDISAPRCFTIEETLKRELSIPVFHDDQHGTAIVTLAGLMNALTLTGKKKDTIRVVVNGAGSAGVAIIKILLGWGVGNILFLDSRGIVSPDDASLNAYKRELAERLNPDCRKGTLSDAVRGADVFIGVSAPGILKAEDVRRMSRDPIIFAMANPDPEITPDEAAEGGAKVIATGRSDFPNQVNNVLAFPGIFRGALDVRSTDITEAMKLAAAEAIASMVIPEELERGVIIPSPFDGEVPFRVAYAAAREAIASGHARRPLSDEELVREISAHLPCKQHA
jgi:malate dehydrogenase (oxaloacetate-decarboxylating)